MEMRRARPTEAAAISELIQASKAHWGYTPAQMVAWREALRVLPATIAACPTYVVEVAGKLAGFYLLEPRADLWNVEHLFVLPAHMGQGLGRALFAHAANTAAQAGASAFSIDADPNAEPFYLACGAVRTDVVAAPIDGQPDRVRPQMHYAIRPAAGRRPSPPA